MSTSYTTNPKIPYNEFINDVLPNHKIIKQDTPKFITDCRVIVGDDQGRKNYIHVHDEDGFCEFTRFGIGNIEPVFREIIKKYNVVITDEYGLPWD